MQCKLCGATSGRVHIAREMMFGMRDEFGYFECESCGSLCLIDVPPDLSKYYPPSYYSFSESSLKAFLKRMRARVVGIPWMNGIRLARTDPILDVGGGAGQNLNLLRGLGFTNLTCVDPYAGRPEVPGKWKLIMFHHSLEHMSDPEAALLKARDNLLPDGFVLVRIPLAGKFAWRRYAVNWVGLDAPRHLFVFSEQAIKALAQKCGFIVERVEFDSAGVQFWASEGYAKDIPLIRQRPSKRWNRLAEELNRNGDGDQACFILRHLSSGYRLAS